MAVVKVAICAEVNVTPSMIYVSMSLSYRHQLTLETTVRNASHQSKLGRGLEAFGGIDLVEKLFDLVEMETETEMAMAFRTCWSTPQVPCRLGS